MVPACVMSGPSPETAALRMRSSWTPQSTTSTSTLMPVFSVNGFERRLHVLLRLRTVGHDPQLHRRAGLDLRLGGRCCRSTGCPSSSPPQPEYTRAPTRTAAIASRIAYLLRTISPPSPKTVSVLRLALRREPLRCGHPLGRCPRSSGAAPDELHGTGPWTAATASCSPSIRRMSAAPAALTEAGLVLADRRQRRVHVVGELDVVEADDRDVGRHVRPASPAARIAPRAIMSDAANTAVGGSSRESRSAIARRPLST